MSEPILYKITRPFITIFMKFVFRPEYIGINYIPECGSIVIAGNHTSNLDSLLLMSSTKRIIHFLAKDSLTKGFFGGIFKSMGIIPVNRKIHDKSALIAGINTLKNSQVVGIFPEGTINKTNDIIMPFKIGAVKMAHDTDSLIIPFTITGKYSLFRKGIVLKYYKPFKITGDLDLENKKFMKLIESNLKDFKY